MFEASQSQYTKGLMMSSLIDVSNSLKTSITDKFTHPLLGSFIISWLFFNWKAVYFMVFSAHDVVYKLKAVSENYSNLYLNLIFPLVSSLALVFLLPLFTAGYTRFIARIKEFQMNSLPELFEPHRLTLDESNSLRDYYDNEFKSLKTELKSATEEITKYRTKDQSEFNAEISNYKSKVNRIFDLFAAIDLNEHILSSKLNPQELDQVIFLEQFLKGHKHHTKLLDNKFYKTSDNELLVELCSSQDLIENLGSETIAITREGIEALSHLKYKAFQKQYDTRSPSTFNVRDSFE